ncbi:hypothetical protein [Nocardia cyriacigeorgica]|uniref:hypothetical protein n=1 Tax=Nocardia cyriacigeorgica TaxID=135487 RepID=UPI003CC7EC1F
MSRERGAFICRACGVKGDIYSIIQHEEGVSFAEAKRIAETVSPGSDATVREQPKRKPRRRVFEHAGSPSTFDRPGSVPVRVRREPPPWA